MNQPQQDTLEAIVRYRGHTGLAPMTRDLAAVLGIGQSTAREHVRYLVRGGYVRRMAGGLVPTVEGLRAVWREAA